MRVGKRAEESKVLKINTTQKMNPLVPSFSAFERVRRFYVIDRQDGFTQNNQITDALTGPKLSRSGRRYCLQHI